jgi:membrane-bound lytic murein transglycosylase D
VAQGRPPDGPLPRFAPSPGDARQPARRPRTQRPLHGDHPARVRARGWFPSSSRICRSSRVASPTRPSAGGLVGLWQFTAGTAKRYGLLVNREVDERRDPEKASRAAARLLRDLYDKFESWDLAIAAYNAGPAPIERALARSPGADFWKLADRGLLPGSTSQYVPKVLATALIASRPERYGLTDVDRSEPLRYDTVVVSQRVDVATIATLCGSSKTTVAELNPSLRTGVVPSIPSGFQVRLPEGTGERFRVEYAEWRSGQARASRHPGAPRSERRPVAKTDRASAFSTSVAAPLSADRTRRQWIVCSPSLTTPRTVTASSGWPT